jgi:HD-GYP domain-containing protein (c-di-GMP phosphodiesterase class II)
VNRKRHHSAADQSIRGILWREIRRPGGFVLAAVVGVTLTLTRRFETVAAYLPFLVPFLVGLLTRVTTRIAARKRELLLSLPGLRTDPAFIMDREGTITASTGKTEDLFEKHGVRRLDQFLTTSRGESATATIMARDSDDTDLTLLSPVTMKWYRVQVRGDSPTNSYLVWLDDATERVRLEERKDALRDFTRRLQHELMDNESARNDDIRLADLLLTEGYGAVMLARVKGDTAEGVVYTSDGRRSETITIPVTADAPIMRSRREGRAIWDSRDSYASDDEFKKAFPVLPEVSDFIGSTVRNLANYHSGDVSIIAFNKKGFLTKTDIAVLESVADTAVTAFSMLDLARRADHRFIQSIHGVCAAAEYSDELTGGHIWRVNDYSRHIAEMLGLSAEKTTEIGVVAAMHDIGKVAIPHLIKLPRKLSEDERREMQMHTVYGAQIIDRMRDASGDDDPRLLTACNIALHHHQHWDGSGYPGTIDRSGAAVSPTSRDPVVYSKLRQPREEAIPREALIVSLADKYDALRSCRQYKPGFSHEKTCDLLRNDDRTGKRGEDVFGPDVFQSFMDTHEKFREIYATARTEALCQTQDGDVQ